MNDLESGTFSGRGVVLVVVDEAHKACKDYAYVKVIEALRVIHDGITDFRVLALSATPGRKPEQVQEIVNNLMISRLGKWESSCL